MVIAMIGREMGVMALLVVMVGIMLMVVLVMMVTILVGQ